MGCRTSTLGAATIKRPCRHPDELSVAASGVFRRDENAVPSEPVDSSESIALDPSDKDLQSS